MKKDIPHIAIEFPDYFPDNFDEFIVDGIENELLDLRVERKEPTAWAASEWIIPGIVAVYILKPYFEAFLKEAGKDHYLLLKNKLNSILAKTKNMNVNTITAKETTNKIDTSNTQSKAISIFIQTKNGIVIKLLYDNNLDLDTWQQSTIDFLHLIEDHYENAKNNSLTEYLNNLEPSRNRTIYGIIDPDSKSWILINNLGQYEREKMNKN
ncbi:hypothetical protein ACT3CE_00595 [Marinifilum sp. RC60d5]|uniref:hypothetical protein n=1 Tax=Marinifilum sp. RC60d5 TaxID=3458414 RepID=UPI004036F9E6